MLNQLSLAAVAAATAAGGGVRPLHGSYCFAGLPGTVHGLFGLPPLGAALPADVLPPMRRVQRVVLVLVDAFGWRLFEQLADRVPFLRDRLADSVVSQLTAQFPSTTAAHITCLHSGQPAGVSGVHEWFYYEPEVDAVIAPLLYAYAGDGGRDTLARFGVRPELLLPPSLYPGLAQAGVNAHIFQLREYAYSAYSRWITRGARLHAYSTLPEALINLEIELERAPAPAYFVLYFDALDAHGHHYGSHARQVEAEALALFRSLEDFFQAVRGRLPDTLFLLTADHGQVAAPPARTLYLNQLAPELPRWLRVDGRGRPLPFGGSARDLFLYVRPECLAEAQARLTEALAGRARVVPTATLMADGWFGPVSQRLHDRVGNLTILPERAELVYWFEAGRFERRSRGHHGGLSPAGMLTPLIASAR